MSGPVRSQASTSGKDITLLKSVAARTANSVRSATKTPYRRHSRKAKGMNFLRHMISLSRHVISKRIANLRAYEEKMRKDHDIFELVIDIRRHPRRHTVRRLTEEEWRVLREIAGVKNSKLEYELEKRDDKAKLKQIKLAQEILGLEFDLQGFKIARIRLKASEE